MVRDTTEGKVNFLNVRFGPMLRRWAEHLTMGRVKYPDSSPGTPNWTLAAGVEEYLRAKDSAARHFESWLAGERDEDHAAGVYFNINVAEYVLERDPSIDPRLGAKVSPEPEPESEPQFGPGAQVRVKSRIDGRYPETVWGALGTIVGPADFTPYDWHVDVKGAGWFFRESDLELV